jgi:hypothetical protein
VVVNDYPLEKFLKEAGGRRQKAEGFTSVGDSNPS